MKNLLVAVILAGYSVCSFGQWSVASSIDAMSDEKKLSAITKNEAGYRIQIYRIKNNGPVWMNFEIPSSSSDMFAPSMPIMYRIDKNKPYTVDLTNSLERVGLINSEWNPKWINFLVWHGDEKSGSSPILSELMRGSKLALRYNIVTGGFRDVEFNLAGGEAAIKNALNVSGSASTEHLDAEKEVRRLIAEHVKICIRKQSGNSECSQKVVSCAKSNTDDITGYKACVGEL